MISAKYFKWLPNALTLSRMLLAIPIFLAASQEAWTWAFWLFIAALLTDFFDGLAAKKLNAKTRLGEELDGFADSVLVATGLTSLSYAGHLSWWFTTVVLAVGAIIGSDRVHRLFGGQRKKNETWRLPVAVTCLFLAWIGIVWYFASLAFGWSWLYVPVTTVVLFILASLKRHRLRTWLGKTNT